MKFEEKEFGLTSLQFSKPPSIPHSSNSTKLISDLDSYFKYSGIDWDTKLIPAGTVFQMNLENCEKYPKRKHKNIWEYSLCPR